MTNLYSIYWRLLCLALLTPQLEVRHTLPQLPFSKEIKTAVVPEPTQEQDDLWGIQLIVSTWLGSGGVLLVLGIVLQLPVLWIIGRGLLLLFTDIVCEPTE